MDSRLDYLSGVLTELTGLKSDDVYHQLQGSRDLKDFLDDPRFTVRGPKSSLILGLV